MPLPDFETAKRLYVDEQKSLTEICHMYGLTAASQSRLSNMLKEHGVQIRPSKAQQARQERLARYRAMGIDLEKEEEKQKRLAEEERQRQEQERAEQEELARLAKETEDDDEEAPKNKGGRPKGSKTQQQKATIGVAKKGDNAKVLKHSMAITEWGSVDMFKVKEVKERVKRYFSLCVAQDMSPTLPGLALAFGVSRFVFAKWVNGADVSPDVATELYRAVCVIDADSAQKMVKGMIHPKSGEFLMKNTLGYRDETTVVQEHVEKRPSVEAIKEKYAKLLGE